MALQKQVIPVSYFQGLDTKSDNKQAQIGSLLNLENGVFKNTGKINKRNGFESIAKTSVFGNISQGKALGGFGNELIEFTGKDVLGFSESENLWINRGEQYSLNSETTSVVNNTFQQTNPECIIVDNLEIYVWEDSRGGVRYSVLDHVTKNYLVSDKIINQGAYKPKLTRVNGQVLIIYALNPGKLIMRKFDSSTPFILGDEIVLANNLLTKAIVGEEADYAGPQYDVLVRDGYVLTVGFTALSGDGYAVFRIATYDSNNDYSEIDHIDVEDESIFGTHIAVRAANLFAFNIEDSSGTEFGVLVATNNNEQQIIDLFTFDVNNLAGSKKTVIVDQPSTNILRVSGYHNLNSGSIVAFYEIKSSNILVNNVNINYGNLVKKATISPNLVVLSKNVFYRCLGLYSKYFIVNNDYLLAFTFQSDFQSTYFIISEAGTIVNRVNIDNGGGYKPDSRDNNYGMVTNVIQEDDGSLKFLIPFEVKTSLISNNNTTYSLLGINVSRMDFTATNVYQNIVSGQNLNVVGGVFKSYDGVNLTENNFLLSTEFIKTDSSQFHFTVSPVGTDTERQSVTIQGVPGYRIQAGDYFTISTPSDTYVFWFQVDSIGTAPSIAGNKVRVQILSSYTKLQVIEQIALSIPLGPFTYMFLGSTVRIQNSFPGVAAAPTSAVSVGNIAAGTYLYNAIYQWTDNLGQNHDSGTAVPLSTTVGGDGYSVSILVPTLKLTEKKNVRIVVYRTENFGSEIFYRVSSITDPLINDPSVDFVSFIDKAADADIISNDLLYTTGGVLDNAAPPPSSIMALYRARLFIAGLEDKNLIWYSQQNVPGLPVQFSDFLTIQVDHRGGDITGLGVIDDKLIIFKESAIFALFGNGPTATGSSDDFSDGVQLVETDIGCSEPNSIVVVPDGLMFKSPKGIYLLNRSLITSYIGAPVQDFNDLTISSALLSSVNNQVRFSSADGLMLVYDYYVQQWSTFTGLECEDAEIVNDVYYILKSDGTVMKESNIPYDSLHGTISSIPFKLGTSWMALNKMQGFQRVYRLLLLGAYKQPHKLRVSIYYNYNEISPDEVTEINVEDIIGSDGSPFNDRVWGAVLSTWGSSDFWGGDYTPWQFRIHLSKQKCESIKVIIEQLDPVQNFDYVFMTPVLPTSQFAYVDVNGSNATGTGTISNPFKTIQAAFAYCTAQGFNSPAIIVNPGDYTADSTSLSLVHNTKIIASAEGVMLGNITVTGLSTICELIGCSLGNLTYLSNSIAKLTNNIVRSGSTISSNFLVTLISTYNVFESNTNFIFTGSPGGLNIDPFTNHFITNGNLTTTNATVIVTGVEIPFSTHTDGFDISNLALEIGGKVGAFKLPAKNSFGNDV